MNIDQLYLQAIENPEEFENRLFEALSVRFQLFAHQRFWDKEDARELAQEALLTVARSYKEMTFEKSFSAWAYKVLINKIRNFHRKSKNTQKFLKALEKTEAETYSPPDDPVLMDSLADCFEQLCETNIRYARVLNLKYQGYGTEMICQKMKITTEYMYVILSRARSSLKACLQKKGVL